MSKRISNKTGKSRKTPARSKVHFGWRKTLYMQRMALVKAQAGETV